MGSAAVDKGYLLQCMQQLNTQANGPQAITQNTFNDSNRSQIRDDPCLRNLMKTG